MLLNIITKPSIFIGGEREREFRKGIAEEKKKEAAIVAVLYQLSIYTLSLI